MQFEDSERAFGSLESPGETPVIDPPVASTTIIKNPYNDDDLNDIMAFATTPAVIDQPSEEKADQEESKEEHEPSEVIDSPPEKADSREELRRSDSPVPASDQSKDFQSPTLTQESFVGSEANVMDSSYASQVTLHTIYDAGET